MGSDGLLARSRLEFCRLGPFVRRAFDGGKMWLLKLLRKHKMIARIYVLFFVLISFVLFNADNMGQAFPTWQVYLEPAEFLWRRTKRFIISAAFL